MGLLLGVIGNPIKHSLSPWIHEQFFELTETKGVYRPFEIKEEKLEHSLEVFKMMGVDGFNVTIPYKEKVMEYLDQIDEEAQKIGAVNTVVNNEGKWLGYNTDGKGYWRSLQSAYPHLLQDIKSKKVLIIGAGGAARGVYRSINNAGFLHVDICNRTVERAHILKMIKNHNVKTDILSLKEAEANIHVYDLIIQTTNIGMVPHISMEPLKLQKLKSNTIVSDIIYNPLETQFLSNAKRLGAHVHFGHGMLLYQAALSFELWSGKHVNPSSIYPRLEQKLKGGS
ncbi:shikimate dehydrogenase [Salirhabdus euzebyi]|uniref:Shikimate dehydrogenase (NADP(+)) n=1 Tax=Salirhabdus euzebyi TaxID=394506 RepID=A0A841Q7H4_9BACI|nr:shikimate dehydrogenase [Salirhabdus euzebyi]MBB6454348.1 shikimate dehydrogenase [Salirhabdus euzebyi]